MDEEAHPGVIVKSHVLAWRKCENGSTTAYVGVISIDLTVTCKEFESMMCDKTSDFIRIENMRLP